MRASHWTFAWVSVMVWGWILSGCAGVPAIHSAESPRAKAHQLDAVPFYPDETDQCGPATLASVLTFWGHGTTPQDLKDEVYVKGLRGSLPIDLLHAAQKRGLEAEFRHGDLDDFKREIDAGHPVVALLNLGYPFFPIGHYVVVTGYDDRRQGLFVHSGLQENRFYPYDRFLRQWEKAGRGVLLVFPSTAERRIVT
ncbi:MAG: C39 family peptidase [Nitrospiraceae bacterium]